MQNGTTTERRRQATMTEWLRQWKGLRVEGVWVHDWKTRMLIDLSLSSSFTLSFVTMSLYLSILFTSRFWSRSPMCSCKPLRTCLLCTQCLGSHGLRRSSSGFTTSRSSVCSCSHTTGWWWWPLLRTSSSLLSSAPSSPRSSISMPDSWFPDRWEPNPNSSHFFTLSILHPSFGVVSFYYTSYGKYCAHLNSVTCPLHCDRQETPLHIKVSAQR